MRGVVAFDDVLDERLKGFVGESPTRAQYGTAAGTAATYGFFFADARSRRGVPESWNTARSADAAPVGRIPGRAHGVTAPPARDCTRHDVHPYAAVTDHVWARPARPTQPVPSQPGRRLSAVQRFALAELIGLGASLDEHFTAEELRSAFRTLARRYHPDRHADRCDVEKAELSMMFRRLHDAYRLLAGAQAC
jgi:hypothetical protein